MKLLIIEDNDLKYGLVEDCLLQAECHTQLTRSGSYQSGVETLLKEAFDFVILDMTLPVFDMKHTVVGTDVLTFGGELILREVQRKKISARFIILSQYDTFVQDTREVTFGELRSDLLRKYPSLVIECLRLDSSSVGWKTELKAIIWSAK